jgi:hypothetical protein
VTWDPSCVKKAKFSKYTGQLLLGYKVAGKSSYHLRVNHPLADDFLLKNGSVREYKDGELYQIEEA